MSLDYSPGWERLKWHACGVFRLLMGGGSVVLGLLLLFSMNVVSWGAILLNAQRELVGDNLVLNMVLSWIPLMMVGLGMRSLHRVASCSWRRFVTVLCICSLLSLAVSSFFPDWIEDIVRRAHSEQGDFSPLKLMFIERLALTQRVVLSLSATAVFVYAWALWGTPFRSLRDIRDSFFFFVWPHTLEGSPDTGSSRPSGCSPRNLSYRL